LVTDIAEFVGPKSVPVIVAVTVYGVFGLGEKLASQRAKDALSKWLVSFDVQKAKALPDGTQGVFDRIFGERHFSLKCFVRSAAFSLGAIALLGIIFLLISTEWFFEKRDVFLRDPADEGIGIASWLLWSILIDYVSLFKTRFILRVITKLRRRHMMVAVAVVGIDYFVYRLLFSLGWAVMLLLVPSANVYYPKPTAWQVIFAVWTAPFIPHEIDLLSILYWAGFVPSLWMWLYVVALFVTRALLRSERIVNWLRWFLDIEKTPFRSIGAVAAVLAFIASVAVLLISAEISRITAA
jgi:hypothetical protein